MGLREDKRQRQRAAILENAIALFRKEGFDAVTVREIARACQISEATFFNYFAAKDAVLGHWVCDRLAETFSRTLDAGESSLRRAVRHLAGELAVLVDSDRTFAAGAWARVRIGQLPLPSQALALIERAQADGELRRDVPAVELLRLLVGTAATTVSSWLDRQQNSDAVAGSAPGGSGASLDEQLRASLDLILDGARRRHERVKAAAARASRPAEPDR